MPPVPTSHRQPALLALGAGLGLLCGNAAAEQLTATPTFHSVGIVWRPDVAPSSGERPSVRYRRQGAAEWSSGDGLLSTLSAPDPSTGARTPEFRGSLLLLHSGTPYQVELTRGSEVRALAVTTWNEVFPVLRTETVGARTAPLVITQGGSPGGYVVYQAEPGAVIDVGETAANCVTVRASYVIVRGFTLRGGTRAAIELVDPDRSDQTPLSDVVVEGNDISAWGHRLADGFGRDYDAAVGGYQPHAVQRLIVQRNVMHDPRYDTNSWYERRSYTGTGPCPSQYSAPGVVDPRWTCHPEGPQAVAVFDSLGSLVIRYNRVFSSNGNRFNDIFGAGSNFSFEGFPGPDSDIYGNELSDGWEDSVEAEGGNPNVRIWGNRIDRVYVGVAMATNSLGPIYVFRNVIGDVRVSDVDPAGAPLADDDPRMMFGMFFKTAPRRFSPSLHALVDESSSQADAEDSAGPIRIFHNTALQPASPTVAGAVLGPSHAISAHQAVVRNVWTRNNVIPVHPGWGLIGPLLPDSSMSTLPDVRNDFDYSLTNSPSMPAAPAGSVGWEAHGRFGVTPTYAAGNPPGQWALAAGTPGHDDGEVLVGLNDGYAGAAPDRGAFEGGAAPLLFGPDAGQNQAPVAAATAVEVVDADGDGTEDVALDGAGSFDPDGWIKTYRWHEGVEELGTTATLTVPRAVGLHSVTLEVGDNAGGLASREVAVQVFAQPDAGPADGGAPTGAGVVGTCGCTGSVGGLTAWLGLAVALRRRRRA